MQASPRHFQHAPGHTVFRLAGACCFTGVPASEKNQGVLLCCSHAVFAAGLTLAGVRLSVVKGGSNKVLAAAQRGGLLFTHKVNWQSCWCARMLDSTDASVDWPEHAPALPLCWEPRSDQTAKE